MHDRPLVDAKLRSTNPSILGKTDRIDYERVGNVSARLDLESGNSKDYIRLAQLPCAFCLTGFGYSILRPSFAPPSTHATILRISACVRDRSL